MNKSKKKILTDVEIKDILDDLLYGLNQDDVYTKTEYGD